MRNAYLIPANTKKSMLIFGLFTTFDIILFGTGLGVTLLMVMFVPLANTLITVIAFAPLCITAFLVMPVPNYHNVLNVIKSALAFFTGRQKYVWKGWCVKDEEDKK